MKRIMALMVLSVLMLSLAACGSAQKPAPTETQAVAAQPEQQETQVFTGILQDKKDFMITVSDEAGNAYAFNLEGAVCDADPGQTVKVTYTGDLQDFDSQLVAQKVEKP